MTETVSKLLPYAKAVTAGLTALVGAVATALVDGKLEITELGGIAGAVVIAVYGVWRTPNKGVDE